MFWKQARENAGLTQAEVAKKFGYTSPQFISNIERGVAPIPDALVPKLMKYYKMDKQDVFDHMLSLAKVRINRVLK